MKEIILKSIDDITIDDVYNLYENEKIATIKIATNEIAFIQE